MNRKETIIHFIKFFIHDEKIGIKNNNSVFNGMELSVVEKELLRFLEPYIEDEHYNFSPFEKINN